MLEFVLKSHLKAKLLGQLFLRLQFTIVKFTFGQQLFVYRFDQNVKHLFNPLIHLNVHPTHYFVLTLPASHVSKSCIKIKINLNFYFHTSLWCLERFYEGLKGLYKTF